MNIVTAVCAVVLSLALIAWTGYCAARIFGWINEQEIYDEPADFV